MTADLFAKGLWARCKGRLINILMGLKVSWEESQFFDSYTIRLSLTSILAPSSLLSSIPVSTTLSFPHLACAFIFSFSSYLILNPMPATLIAYIAPKPQRSVTAASNVKNPPLPSLWRSGSMTATPPAARAQRVIFPTLQPC